MLMKSWTEEATAFIPLGLTDAPELQVPLFSVISLIYTVTVAGNLGLVLRILLDSRLHTPTYFFLGNLSLVGFCHSSAVTLTVMAWLLAGDQVISYDACAAQTFFFGVFATVENYILASVACDRCAAVCKPLHDTISMMTSMCACLAGGILTSSVMTGDTFSLCFCRSNVLHHFFCEVPAVMALTCSDRQVNELVLVYMASFNIFFAFLVILVPYLLIFITILKMHSAASHQKALSTCASHLTAVSIFYGAAIFMYLQPSSSHSMDTDKMASVFYTMVIPMLNTLVYGLRNKEVKSVLRKVVGSIEEAALWVVYVLCHFVNT